VPRPLRTLRTLVLALLVAAAAAAATRAQTPTDRLDPLLRPLLNPAVVSQIEATPRLDAVGTALRRPLADVVVLRHEVGRAETFVDVFVSLADPSPAIIEALGGEVTAHAGALLGARVPVSALRTLQADRRVRYIQAAHRLRPSNDLAMLDIHASAVRAASNGTFTGATGTGVIVGVFDTGIDWSHADFKHANGSTRILYIWDMTTTGTPPGNVAGQTFTVGNECSAAIIDAGSCSEQDIAAHGSHVTGSAAGNGAAGNASRYAGVAPNADIIAVKGGNGSFSGLDVVTGIEYIFRRAAALGRPAVVNLSLGSLFGPHDGSDAQEQALDSLSGPGRIVVVAAGNSGSNPTATTGNTPIRYVHATRTLAVSGDSVQLSVSVPAYSPAAGTLNNYMLFNMWYDGRDSLTITVRRPDGSSFSRSTGDSIGENEGVQGHITLDNASGGPAPQNGDRQAEIEMYDALPGQVPAPGTWTITIRLKHLGGSGRFDIWEYGESGTLAGSQISGGGDNAYLVSTPGNAAQVIAVAAHVNRVNWAAQGGNFQFTVREQVGDLGTFSASGPTRPVRGSPSVQKPELSAPGKGVFSVYSRASNPPAPSALVATDGVHVLLSGTSMATPMVTGSVALLLERRPDLTPANVRTILTTSARQDGFTSASYAGFGAGVPNPSWGYGKLDVQAALAQAPPALTVALGGNSPTPTRLKIGTSAAIQFALTAAPAEGERLDTITVAGTSNHALSDFITELDLYRDSAGTGTIPSSLPLVALPAPFAAGAIARFGSLASSVAAGGQLAYLLVLQVNNHLRQGDTLDLRVSAVSGTGIVSTRRAVGYIPAPVASQFGRAELLQGNEAVLISENPVRSGRVIFSYDSTPHSMSLYNFAGLRVRDFSALPASRFEWDVRGESPGLPNGMYILVVNAGARVLRQRLMILSPAR
jgi:subtilisin family serine protease